MFIKQLILLQIHKYTYNNHTYFFIIGKNFALTVGIYDIRNIHNIGQVRYGNTCRDGTSPRSPFCSIPSAYSGPSPGPLTIPSYDPPTALTTTGWGAPAGGSSQPDPLHLGCSDQDHPLGNAPHGHQSAVGAHLSSR